MTLPAGIPRIPPLYDPRNRILYEELVKERQEKLASKFCDLMTADISFEFHNDYRLRFYKEVILQVDLHVFYLFLSSTDTSSRRNAIKLAKSQSDVGLFGTFMRSKWRSRLSGKNFVSS